MSERVECVVVGAGVIGLAIARALALAGREVVVIEAAEAIGTETSSRNSEVIHAGIYYEPSSLKARFCVAGKRALYCYCAEHGVAHRAVTKLIVATSPAQIGVLHSLQAQAAANGVDDLRLIDADEARAMEPALRCVAALHSPSTGIIDSHGFMLALQGDAEARGAAIAFNAPLIGGTARDHAIELRVGGDDPITLSCRLLVNAAGLRAQRVAASLRGVPAATIPPTHFAKGNYFALAGKPPVSRLIYPVPEPGGLGVHITLDLSGQCRFGPDVEWIERVDYDVDPRRAERFYAAIRRYWPDLPDGALQPAYAGIRPKLGPAGAPAADFTIHGPRDHGIAGLVCLYGIESPGITAALAIADHVVSVLTTAP